MLYIFVNIYIYKKLKVGYCKIWNNIFLTLKYIFKNIVVCEGFQKYFIELHCLQKKEYVYVTVHTAGRNEEHAYEEKLNITVFNKIQQGKTRLGRNTGSNK